MVAGGARACRGRQVRPPWYIGWWRPCPSCRRRKPSYRRSWWPYGRGWLSATVISKPHPPSCTIRYLGRMGRAEATAHCGAGRRTSPRAPGTHQTTSIMDRWGLLSWLGSAQEGEVARIRGLGLPSWPSMCPIPCGHQGPGPTSPEVIGSMCRHERSRKAQGRSRPEASAESTPSSKVPWLGQPRWTKLIAEVTPWKTGRK